MLLEHSLLSIVGHCGPMNFVLMFCVERGLLIIQTSSPLKYTLRKDTHTYSTEAHTESNSFSRAIHYINSRWVKHWHILAIVSIVWLKPIITIWLPFIHLRLCVCLCDCVCDASDIFKYLVELLLEPQIWSSCRCGWVGLIVVTVLPCIEIEHVCTHVKHVWVCVRLHFHYGDTFGCETSSQTY